MDIKTDFAEYLYSRLPSVYRVHDMDSILKSLISTFVEGGFNYVINDNIRMFDLLDVDKCPKKFLPLLCKMYGFEYSEEIPELFTRRLLKNIVEMYKRKGTKSVIKFIARELTGFESELIENKDFTEEDIKITGWNKTFVNYRNFILKLESPYEDSAIFTRESVVAKVIHDFLPTNSKVLIITAYWFEDFDNISNRCKESNLKDKIKSLLEETLEVVHSTNYSDCAILNKKEEDESIAITDRSSDDVNSLLNSNLTPLNHFILNGINRMDKITTRGVTTIIL